MNKKLSRVLMIEDDQDQVLLYQTFFDFKKEFDFAICSQGQKAITKARTLGPDLILMDLVLEDKDGLELLKEFKANPETANIPIVVFSNKTQKGLPETLKEAGARDYWLKTEVLPHELTDKIKEILNDL